MKHVTYSDPSASPLYEHKEKIVAVGERGKRRKKFGTAEASGMRQRYKSGGEGVATADEEVRERVTRADVENVCCCCCCAAAALEAVVVTAAALFKNMKESTWLLWLKCCGKRQSTLIVLVVVTISRSSFSTVSISSIP